MEEPRQLISGARDGDVIDNRSAGNLHVLDGAGEEWLEAEAEQETAEGAALLETGFWREPQQLRLY